MTSAYLNEIYKNIIMKNDSSCRFFQGFFNVFIVVVLLNHGMLFKRSLPKRKSVCLLVSVMNKISWFTERLYK